MPEGGLASESRAGTFQVLSRGTFSSALSREGDVPLRVEPSAVTAPGLHVARPCDR